MSLLASSEHAHGHAESLLVGWSLHALIGLIFAATGFAVRSACDHRGWLPHPIQQVSLTVLLVLIESTIAFLIVG